MSTLSPSIPAPTRRELAGISALIVWLGAGYAVILAAALGLGWQAAVGQSLACVAAAGPLLLTVIGAVSLPKKVLGVSRAAYHAMAVIADAMQYVIPWLGWSALIWGMNASHVSFGTALLTGAYVSAFSLLTGLALMLVLRPRACDVEVTCLEISVERLPPAFDGYRILHVSDMHAGSRLSRTSVRDRLHELRAPCADLVVFTGDLAASERALEESADALAELSAHDGSVAVLGNHDHWIGEERVTGALAARGIVVLGNGHLKLQRNGDALYIVGVKDASYVKRDDLEQAFAGVPPEAPAIMLTHSPDIIYKPLSRRASLVLSGHTHGGQVVLPWIGPLYVPTRLGRRRMSGLLQAEGQLVYINRGLGEVFPPMRLGCPPEVALLTLRRGSQSV